MAIAKLVSVGADAESHHGVRALTLHVDDPLPRPTYPVRYAVRVTPDLARYLLTFNHPENRALRPRKITQFASDMAAGRWRFTPESVVFSTTGVLQNGQNRLIAVTVFGGPVWLMLDFGWPDDIITVIDRGAARTNQDTMHVSGQANSAAVASVITKVWKYDQTIGMTRGWTGMSVPSSAEALAMVEANAEDWQIATRAAQRIYRALDNGNSTATWGATYYIIARAHPNLAEPFFDEIVEGAGAVGSATRQLADWFRRRPSSATKTGDDRESAEVIIRGFNAWLTGKPFAFPKFRGFALSRVKSA